MKRKLTFITLIGMLMLCMLLTSCSSAKKDASFVSLDINPSIELTLDENNKVTSVYAANEDARILLYGEEGIIGKDIEEAIEIITQLSLDMGFINEDNKVIGTSVTSSNEEWATKVKEKVDSSISATAKESGFSITVSGEYAYSLLRQLEAYKAEYPNDEAIQRLTPEKFKLALSASENGDITLEAAITMDDKALVEKINEVHKEIELFATDAYNKAKSDALSLYDEMSGVLLDGVYTEFYLKNLFAHPTTCWYGATYQLYKTSARGFNAIARAMEFVEKMEKYPLNDVQIDGVMAALGMDESEKAQLQDADGNITVESVYAYADKRFKNTPASAELEAMKTELDNTLDSIESAVKEEIIEALKDYKPYIDDTVESASAAVNAMLGTLPPAIKTALEEQMAEFESVVNELSAALNTDKLSSEKLRDCADRMDEAAKKLLTKIEADLSETELASIEERKTQLESSLSTYKQQLENAITKAENDAKARLEQLKADRINAN